MLNLFPKSIGAVYQVPIRVSYQSDTNMLGSYKYLGFIADSFSGDIHKKCLGSWNRIILSSVFIELLHMCTKY